jgi:alpha-1,2-glucosyltransferase
VGDRNKHEIGFSPTNIAYFLLCAWFVFLPQNLQAVPRIGALLRRPANIALLVVGFALYMVTYANTHQFNGPGLRFYLHNEGLYWLTKYTWIRAAAFVPMAWMVLTLCVTRLADARLHILFLIAPLSVGLHPLIEPRYYLPALTLFQVWRPTTGARWENAMLVLNVIVTAGIMWGITSERFFL